MFDLGNRSLPLSLFNWTIYIFQKVQSLSFFLFNWTVSTLRKVVKEDGRQSIITVPASHLNSFQLYLCPPLREFPSTEQNLGSLAEALSQNLEEDQIQAGKTLAGSGVKTRLGRKKYSYREMFLKGTKPHKQNPSRSLSENVSSGAEP